MNKTNAAAAATKTRIDKARSAPMTLSAQVKKAFCTGKLIVRARIEWTAK